MLPDVDQNSSNSDKSYASVLQKRLHNSWFKVLDNRAPAVSKEIRSGNYLCRPDQFCDMFQAVTIKNFIQYLGQMKPNSHSLKHITKLIRLQ